MPRIAIPQPHFDAVYTAKHYPLYAAAVERSGGSAVMIPLDLSAAEIAQILKHCDACLLPGCHADIDPQCYNHPRHPLTSDPDPLRAGADELILQDAFNMRKPVLGICYGAQSLNTWRQGTLCQHLETSVQHARLSSDPLQTIRHDVCAVEGTRLAEIMGARGITDAFPVQSTHHQAIENVGDRLRVAAHSPADGVIEAVEGTESSHFVLGVQWHPERSFDDRGAEGISSRALFAALVQEAILWQRQARYPGDFETAQPF